jgi:hypothetical protein
MLFGKRFPTQSILPIGWQWLISGIRHLAQSDVLRIVNRLQFRSQVWDMPNIVSQVSLTKAMQCDAFDGLAY